MSRYLVLLIICVSSWGVPGLAWTYDALLQGGAAYARDDAGDTAEGSLYTCPMHPQIVRDAPGQCPICGMDLVPQEHPGEGEKEAQGQEMIRVDPVTVQNMGVRVDAVKRSIVHRHIRTFGRVETPDDAYAVVNLKFSGWVGELWADKPGAYVKKGERLFAIYSPEVFSAEREYVLALKNYGPGHSIAQSAENRLRLWDIPDREIQRIRKEREARKHITVSAPASGFIEHLDVMEGSHIAAGKDLYRIVNLERVWLMAEVYDFDAPWIKEGAEVKIDFAIPGFTRHESKISFIYPTLNAKTRTLTVRAELENPEMKLKPGMIANLLIYAHSDEEKLVIPSESIIHTGERRIVFVTENLGRYEPREVETGLVGDNDVTEVVAGLEEGETIVISGQFLLDSESQLQEAVKKFLEAQVQSGQDLSEAHIHGREEGQQDKGLYTCPMHPQILREAPGQCPICGMDLVETE